MKTKKKHHDEDEVVKDKKPIRPQDEDEDEDEVEEEEDENEEEDGDDEDDDEDTDSDDEDSEDSEDEEDEDEEEDRLSRLEAKYLKLKKIVQHHLNGKPDYVKKTLTNGNGKHDEDDEEEEKPRKKKAKGTNKNQYGSRFGTANHMIDEVLAEDEWKTLKELIEEAGGMEGDGGAIPGKYPSNLKRYLDHADHVRKSKDGTKYRLKKDD